MLDRDLELKKTISQNIKSLMKTKGWTQLDLSEKSGISKSTISDYINFKTLINLGNVQKLADVFGVEKSNIDPSFERKQKSGAYHYDADFTPEEIDEMNRFAEFVLSKRKNKEDNL